MMFRIIALLLSLTLNASAQMAPWQPMVLGGGVVTTPPTTTFIGTFAESGDPTHTATINIGNPSYIATRRVYIVNAGGNSGGVNSITACTINGVACDVKSVFQQSGAVGAQFIVLSAVVTTGTTGVTATWTYNFSLSGSGDPVGVYIVDNSLMTAPTTLTTSFLGSNSTPSASIPLSIATQAGGLLFGIAWGGGGTGPTVSSGSASFTNDFSNNADLYASANNTTASGALSATFNMTAGTVGNTSVAGLVAIR